MRRFRHLPDMPAAVSLKFTSMSWTSDGRLVMLARTAGREVVASGGLARNGSEFDLSSFPLGTAAATHLSSGVALARSETSLYVCGRSSLN